MFLVQNSHNLSFANLHHGGGWLWQSQSTTYPAAIRELKQEGCVRRCCRQRTRRYSNNRIESDHCHIKRRLGAMQGPRTQPTAWAVIQGIEAAQ